MAVNGRPQLPEQLDGLEQSRPVVHDKNIVAFEAVIPAVENGCCLRRFGSAYLADLFARIFYRPAVSRRHR